MIPEEFKQRMQNFFDKDEYEEFIGTFEKAPAKGLKINPLKKGYEGVKDFFNLESIPWSENGFYYDPEEAPGKHPLHEAGAYYIQEPSAMAVSDYAAARPGERVLDLCAAPGGKSIGLAMSMKNKGLLVSNEIVPKRAKILSENIERMGISNAVVINEDPEKLKRILPGFFDCIVVDAPCSGEGMFRKNEEAGGEWSPENVALCAKRQDMILDAAAEMLKSGGRIIYSTCTFAPEEDEGSINRFLIRHTDYSVGEIKSFEGFDSGIPTLVENGREELKHTLRLFPHHIRGEGHFIALLKHNAEEAGGAGFAWLDRIDDKTKKLWLDFKKEAGIKAEFNDSYTMFGNNLYALPEEMIPLKGIKTLRAGLMLGEVKKDRFVPSHSLALFLEPDEAFSTEIESIDAARAYLKGETLNIKVEKGWRLVTFHGFSLGWGKSDGRIIKNHYPKGLRKT
ncbi:MAG: RsmB/NOP family class I SAM-dependent RNA methyltransferase [Lachnospiraceae bacterium]|nr:RsmB/NOP family class I SAM-dependent RNA methyltransferase [Lachnospiraceae bacterium]